MGVLLGAVLVRIIQLTVSSALTIPQPGWSQVQPPLAMADAGKDEASTVVDPRVGRTSKGRPRALILGAKSSGGNSFIITNARKRAFCRAQRRALEHGQTMYRGRLHSVQSLQGMRVQAIQTSASRCLTPAARTGDGRRNSRLKVATWNMGGCTSDAYDVLCDWLMQQTTLDALYIQETHFGMGRQAAQWSIEGWTFFSSPEPGNRYAGVAIAISHRLAQPTDMTYCEWLPGRVLQVRAETLMLNLDMLNVYQWVRERNPSEDKQSKRERVWQILGRALHSIPRRNLLLRGGDLNSSLRAHTNLVGRGLLKLEGNQVDEELMSILVEHQLCALNTWGASRAGQCATFRNGQHRSQLDYFMVRKHAADSQSRRSQPVGTDLTPWRQGPKHYMLECSIPKVAGWRLEQVRAVPRVIAYSKEDMRWHQENNTDHYSAFQEQVTAAVNGAHMSTTVSQLNFTLLQLCRDAFPPRVCRTQRAGATAEVRGNISRMWAMHRALKARRPGTSFLQIFAAWRRYKRFMQAWRSVRRAGRTARRQRIEALVQRKSSG